MLKPDELDSTLRGETGNEEEPLQQPSFALDHNAGNQLMERPGGIPHPGDRGYIVEVEDGGNSPYKARVFRQGPLHGDHEGLGFSEDQFSCGSCNGLLYLTNPLDHICLWNPAMNRVKDISDFAIRIVDSTGEVSVGFGFDGKTNDYKVVRIK
ncbi:hypothetical protein POM88_052997 [Heracleum sosnowskyi]|uniref:Uncharacterized protein n=1 Tax=Heracleum sosnowskyi TaxID=360622 RepID=A0AAD8GRZ6_9APIA|nr:hypothetical protein POM88_052997 [Heracleum sosnowskyi]